MYRYMTEKKGSLALLMILLVAEGVAGGYHALQYADDVLKADALEQVQVVAQSIDVFSTVPRVEVMGTTKLTAGSLEKSTERFARSAEEYMAEIKDDFGGFRLVRSFGIIKSILEKHIRTSISGCTAIQIAAAAPKDTTHSNTPMMFSKQTPSNRFKLLLTRAAESYASA